MKKKVKITTAILLSLLLFSGCGVGIAQEETFESNYENDGQEEENIYVSATDAVIKAIDTEAQILDLYVLGSGDEKSLVYDGATLISDKYGQPLVASQLTPGDVVKVAYNSGIGKAGVIQQSPDAWKMDDIAKYDFSGDGRTLSIGSDLYSLDEHVHIFSGDHEITPDQLVEKDVLSIQGNDRNVVSIRVMVGHGYLELKNEYALVGGWIEVGQTLISQIAENMLFTIPEGAYSVRLTNDGIEEYRDITVTRNEITELDLSDIVALAPEKGRVRFEVTPEGAEVMVDDNVIHTEYSVRLPVGTHKITASCPGYATVTEYFDVDGLDKTVKIDLQKITETSVSGNSVTREEDLIPTPDPNAETENETKATITVALPEGVDLYEDNLYKGITPLTYQKTPGTHILTIRKEGYETTSYTIIIENDDEDVLYHLPDMWRPGEKPEDRSSVSGNDLNASPSPSPSPSPGKEFFPNGNRDLVWEDDLKVLSEDGLRQALSQLEKDLGTDKETDILRENIIRIKKALTEWHGAQFEEN